MLQCFYELKPPLPARAVPTLPRVPHAPPPPTQRHPPTAQRPTPPANRIQVLRYSSVVFRLPSHFTFALI